MNKNKIILLTTLLLIIVSEIIFIFTVCLKDDKKLEMVYDDYYKNIDITNESKDMYSLPSDEYYNKYFKVLNTTKANKSKKVMSVKEVNEFLKNRGFKDYKLEVDYSIDGEFLYDDNKELQSNEKYPMYQILYRPNLKEMWTIYVIENSIYAYPVSYVVNNMEKIDREILVSETSDIVVYSSDLNNYYKLKPNKNLIDVRLIKKIDASTLNKYKFE